MNNKPDEDVCHIAKHIDCPDGKEGCISQHCMLPNKLPKPTKAEAIEAFKMIDAGFFMMANHGMNTPHPETIKLFKWLCEEFKVTMNERGEYK